MADDDETIDFELGDEGGEDPAEEPAEQAIQAQAPATTDYSKMSDAEIGKLLDQAQGRVPEDEAGDISSDEINTLIEIAKDPNGDMGEPLIESEFGQYIKNTALAQRAGLTQAETELVVDGVKTIDEVLASREGAQDGYEAQPMDWSQVPDDQFLEVLEAVKEGRPYEARLERVEPYRLQQAADRAWDPAKQDKARAWERVMRGEISEADFAAVYGANDA